jgi:perosamine synthetase
MVVTDDDRLADRLRLARSHGATEKYLHAGLGFNYRLTDVQAALGLGQLQRLPGFLARRRENARFLTSRLGELPGVTPPFVPDTSRHSFNQYCVLVNADGAGIDRDTLARRLLDRGVETAVHYPRPLHRQPLFARDPGGVVLPVSEDLSARILALPVHPKLDQTDLEQVVRAVADAVR